jgi:hypothetical protein
MQKAESRKQSFVLCALSFALDEQLAVIGKGQLTTGN